jgi:hypothetical protein
MNADPSGMQGQPGGPAPSEEELRAAYEAELARINATDMIAQAAVSLLNIGAHRMGAPAGEGGEPLGQDLEQARDAIDAARALLEILERRMPGELGPLRDALSRLQMAYAAEAGRAGAQAPDAQAPQPAAAGAPAPGTESPGAQAPADAPQQGPGQPGPGPAESSGRLWVPGR